MLGHIGETDLSVPYREGGYLYYSRTEEGKQYPIYCRRKDARRAQEVTVDLNELAGGNQFMAPRVMHRQRRRQLLAYSTDSTGFREYTLHEGPAHR
jgi:oligopeptidase B